MNKNFVDDMLIEEEIRRIEPQMCEGDMQAEVKSDMGKWAKASGLPSPLV